MFEGKRVLVVVPARGGSKGVPLKNLKELNGIPLVAWTGKVLSALSWIDKAVVSTDHKGIAKAAQKSGLDCPFYRPEELSGDRISDWQVLDHALRTMESIDSVEYDVVILLHPTTPLRRPEHITSLVKKLITESFDAVWGISESDLKYHPQKALNIEGERLAYYDEEVGPKIIARQQLKPLYHRNGLGYAFTRECLLEQKNIMGKNTSFLLVDETMVSIDTLEDIEETEEAFRRRDSK